MSMASYEKGYDSDGNIPCSNLKALDANHDDFNEAVLGDDGSPTPGITQLIPKLTANSVGNLTIVWLKEKSKKRGMTIQLIATTALHWGGGTTM